MNVSCPDGTEQDSKKLLLLRTVGNLKHMNFCFWKISFNIFGLQVTGPWVTGTMQNETVGKKGLYANKCV